MELIAANGQTVSASKVFSHALSYFKFLSLREINDLSPTLLSNDDIQWVITVPAIWRPSARQFMRKAAIEVFELRRNHCTYMSQSLDIITSTRLTLNFAL